MRIEDQDLETRRIGIALLGIVLGFAALFVIVGAAVSMLMH
jgi:hypothetical protein